MFRQLKKNLVATLIAAMTIGQVAPAFADSADTLPDMGTSAGSTLSIGQEMQMGDYYVRQLRGSAPLINDPLLTQYINSLEVQNGEIRAFAESQSRLPEAMDGEGGWLLPGLIELHTDNLDKFFTPRPKVDWPAHSAMSSHDALMVASGITTVLDAVAIGDVRDGGDRLENLEKMINAIEETQ
eukprot:109324_1